jgi:integrase
VARVKRIVKKNGLIQFQAVGRINGRERFGTRHDLKRDALAAARAMESAADAGRLPAKRSRLTFAEYAWHELENRRLTEANRTRVEHRLALVLRVAGDMHVSKIDVAASKRVARLLGELRKKDGNLYSPGVTGQAWSLYLSLLHSALEDGVAAQLVIPRRVSPAKHPAAEKRKWLTPPEKAALVAAFWDEHAYYAPLVEFLFESGVRVGEAIALTKADFNFFSRIVTVRATITRVGGMTVLGPTKGRESRQFELDERVARIVRQHFSTRPDSPWAFPGDRGERLAYAWFLRRVWKPVTASAGLTGITPHVTRHQMITEWLYAGVPSSVVARRSGHGSTGVLDRTYAHVQVDADRAALMRVAEFRVTQSEIFGSEKAGQRRANPEITPSEPGKMEGNEAL